MEELSSLKFLCKLQRLVCSSVQLKPEVSLPVWYYEANHHDWCWMFGCWHAAVFRNINIHTLRSDHSVCWRQEKRWKFSRWNKMKILFPVFFKLFNKRVLLYRRFWTIAALNRGFLQRLRYFLSSFWPSWTQYRLKFCSAVIVFSYSSIACFRRPFDGFLANKLRLSWSRTIL